MEPMAQRGIPQPGEEGEGSISDVEEINGPFFGSSGSQREDLETG
jgi:hypothetical protein